MLEGVGEDTEDALWEFCYPVLDRVKGEIFGTPTPADATRIRQAVREERERVRPAEVDEPETELGRDIRKQLGAPTVLVDRVVREGGEEPLRKLKPPRKPH